MNVELTDAQRHYLQRIVRQHMKRKESNARQMRIKFKDDFDPEPYRRYVAFAESVIEALGVPVRCSRALFPDGTRCGDYGWHASNCPEALVSEEQSDE